jgi:hypothetical protein
MRPRSGGTSCLGVVRADRASRCIPIAKRDAMNYRVIPVWPRE